MAYTEEQIKLWTEQNVGQWLFQAGLRYCADEFKSLQITGVRLLLLGPDDLKSFESLKGSDKRRKAVKKALSTLPGNNMGTGGKKKFGKFGKKDPPPMRRPIHQQNAAQPPLPPPPGAPPLPSRPGPPAHAPPLPPRGAEEEQDVYEEFDEALHGGGGEYLTEEAFDAEDSFDEDESAPVEQGFTDIAAKFRAFGIGGPSRAPEEEDGYGDDGEDIYDVPPDEEDPAAMHQAEDSDDEPSDIYDLPPDSEMMQGHMAQYPPPPPPPPTEHTPMPYLVARGHSIPNDIYEMADPEEEEPEGIYEMQDEEEEEPEGIYEMQDEGTEDIYDVADEDDLPPPVRPPKPGAGGLGQMSHPPMRPPLRSPRSGSPERGDHETEPAPVNSKAAMPEYLRERFERAKNRPNTSAPPSAQVSSSSVSAVEPERPSPPQGRAPMPLPPKEPQVPSPPLVERGPPRLPPKEFSGPTDRPPARPPKEIVVSPPAIPPKESPPMPRKGELFTDGPPQLPPKEAGLGVEPPRRPPKPGSPMAERHQLKSPSPAAPSRSPISSPALQRPPKPSGLSKEESTRPPRAQKPPPSPQMSHRPPPPPQKEISPEEVSCPSQRDRSVSPDASDPKLKRRSSGKIADLMSRFEQRNEDSHPPIKPKPVLARRWPPVQSDREEHQKPAPPSKPQLPEKEKPPPPSKPTRPFPPPSEAHSRPSPPSSPISRRPPVIPLKSELPPPPRIPIKEPPDSGATNSNIHTVHVPIGRPALPTPKERIRSPSPPQVPPSLPSKPRQLGGEVPPRRPEKPQLFPMEDRPPPPIPDVPPAINIFREMKPKTSGFPPPMVRPPAPPQDDKPSIPPPVPNNNMGFGRAPPPVPAVSNRVFEQPWYHGNIDRHEVQRRLAMFPKDGCFLVRAAQKGDGFSLSLWYGGQARHLRIRQREDNQYAVGEKKESEVCLYNVLLWGKTDKPAFPDVLDLVAYHQKEPLVLKSGGQTLLAHVCPKN